MLVDVQGNQRMMKEALDLILKCAFGAGPRAPSREYAALQPAPTPLPLSAFSR